MAKEFYHKYRYEYEDILIKCHKRATIEKVFFKEKNFSNAVYYCQENKKEERDQTCIEKPCNLAAKIARRRN